MSVNISDEEELVGDDSQEGGGNRFKKVPTLPAAVVQIGLCLAQIILVFALPSLYDRSRHGTPDRSFGSFSLLIYTHSAHWACFLIIDQYLHHHHHKSRLEGYLEFYVRTKNIRRAPFYILSVGNAVLMIVVMVLHDLCDSEPCSHTFTKVDYLRGLITLESLIVICLVVSYIYILQDHHTKALPPDVLRGDLFSSLGGGPLAAGGRPVELLGCQEQEQRDEVMERQAETIRYLQEHTETLCRKIQVLTQQLGQKERLA